MKWSQKANKYLYELWTHLNVYSFHYSHWCFCLREWKQKEQGEAFRFLRSSLLPAELWVCQQTRLDVFYSLAFKHELHFSFHDLVQLFPSTDEISGKAFLNYVRGHKVIEKGGKLPLKYNMLTPCRVFYIRPCLHPPFGTLESFSANDYDRMSMTDQNKN